MDRATPPRLTQDTPTGKRMPEKFGRYMLIERIGSGGMAEVFRAITFGWEGFRRVIVVKRIRRELSDTAEFLQMFFDEAKISALLHHPNVVQVYDFGQVDGAYFLAMEHIDGKDLASVMRALRASRLSFDPTLAAFVGHEMALGLHYAHTLKGADGRPFDIVHRDINPANVMLVRTGGVKVLDFGIAKASEAAGKTQTQRAIVKGKLSYLSPEQARCHALDARSDLFSWGSTMWELLTGHRLFAGRTDFDRLNAVKHVPVIAPSRRRPELPTELDRIVLRALERDTARRYQTAAEIAADLDAYLKTSPLDPDAIPRLLADLFGEESSRNIIIPTGAEMSGNGSDSGPTSDPGEATSGPGGQPEEGRTLVDSLESDGSGEADVPQRRAALVWAAGAALVVAAVALGSWSLRARPVAPDALPPPGLAAPSEPAAAAAPPAGAKPGPAAPATLVKIDVDSEPQGATVSGSLGLLGKTPLTVTFPASSESEPLRFEKPGFEPASYEVRPKSAGVVFVELRRLK